MEQITCDNIETAINEFESRGYRLDMIKPADAPREALMSNNGEAVRLMLQKPAHEQGRNTQDSTQANGPAAPDWITGRAGMEYRDLIPDRMHGEVIASHIRLTKGGEVPDYVHYHKVDFQLIRCLKGRIRVVYEDQGEPFWLEPGDYVIQPPEIRHRVLECTAGSEVMEISIPAEHETWIDHEITLPTKTENRERLFSGQRFVHHIAEKQTERP